MLASRSLIYIGVGLYLALQVGAWGSDGQEQSELEEIVVTGSYIRRPDQADSSSAFIQFDQASLQDNSVKDIRDLIELMPINSGAQNNSDNLTQNFTAGTSNINLRGLGVSSTLVLLNGRRQVLSAVQTNDGSSFVDTASLVPMLAIERLEVLKDGASAVYGSDAVAGVANFITRSDFEGFELQWEYRERTDNGTQDDTNIDLIAGASTGDHGHFLIALSYLDRSSLVAGEVDWLDPIDGSSGFGNPGSFVVPSAGLTVADPDCETFGGIFQQLNNGSTLCRFDFGPQVTFVPDEQRLLAFAQGHWAWSDNTELWAEIGHARNDISREVSPSFPVLNTPLIPAGHPLNFFEEDVFFQGRPYGNGQPTEINRYKHNTFRAALGVSVELSGNRYLDASFVSAKNDALINVRDVIAANFQAALMGLGGINCVGNSPGVNGCQYFNPFSSAFNVAPNDPQLKNYIIGDYLGDALSELKTLEVVYSGDLIAMRDGMMAFALGLQRREESLRYTYDSITQQDGYAFLIGNPNFSGSRDVDAIFGELFAPVTANLELRAALRYEDYGGGVGDTMDPRLSLLWRPRETISLRASASTSFRAPSVFQTAGIQTSFVNITDADGSTTFAGNRTVGRDSLVPEQSTAYNLGVSWEIDKRWNLDLDYWRYSFEDVLTQESAQTIVSNDPFDERVERTSAGTIAIVRTAFVNANEITTDGIDLNVVGTYNRANGTWTPTFNASYLLSYDLVNANGVRIDGAGQRNGTNYGNPAPEFRANLGLNWAFGQHSANLFWRYVSSYDDEQTGQGIDHFSTFDLQYSLNLGSRLRKDSETQVTLGVINITDENPPFVAIAGNYDPRTGDPRGRRVFLRIGFRL
ncbi:TonB-dependent receptor [Pseudomaricurvus alkylphenolicus]|uniref:TonB-dependent receptor domain-containing protein n=1 Tax=Pseudomaricurvus alkylphenolicus TaxID=1306991 RepID=UPI0014246D6C|nr:TonB-dependent receptor [Pseudomaricurvus alkylphenolicus]NIB43631.1 TonB-dependent receptor [Pseudomaricurvus alkylphenolicus]